MADRIAVLNEGQIVQIGSPHDIYDRPASVFVAELVGVPRINLLDAEREDGFFHVNDSPIRIPERDVDHHIPDLCRLGVRPEDIRLGQEGEFQGEVILAEPLGVETVLHVKAGEKTLISTQAGISQWRMGDQVRFNVMRERLHFFDPGGDRI
jgi:ABC-type sugar transport system ATPase subunit